MSPELWRERIAEMCADIERVGAFIGALDRDGFVHDEKTVFAVCYAFVRLGEGVGHIPQDVMTAHPEVEWREIRHFRNFMIHVYLAVDPARVYDTAKTDLPSLLSKLRVLLEPPPPPPVPSPPPAPAPSPAPPTPPAPPASS